MCPPNPRVAPLPGRVYTASDQMAFISTGSCTSDSCSVSSPGSGTGIGLFSNSLEDWQPTTEASSRATHASGKRRPDSDDRNTLTFRCADMEVSLANS